jgi:hypothetical protein
MFTDFFGTAENDLIIIRGSDTAYDIEINGAHQSTSDSVMLHAGNGDDTILLEQCPSDVREVGRLTVFGEGGNDTFETSSNSLFVIPDSSPLWPKSVRLLTIDGGPGADLLMLDDSEAEVDSRYVFESNTFQRSARSLAPYATLVSSLSSLWQRTSSTVSTCGVRRRTSRCPWNLAAARTT